MPLSETGQKIAGALRLVLFLVRSWVLGEGGSVLVAGDGRCDIWCGRCG